VRGLSDLHLLETPVPDLLHEVSRLEPEPSGHVLLDGVGVRSTQRLALGDVGGGIAAFTWPAELQPQARYLYRGERAHALIDAADKGGWDVDMRPHLAFWLSSPEERVYLKPTISLEEYVAQWAGPDRGYIRQHDRRSVLPELWPWLLERGYASPEDEAFLGRYLDRLTAKKRAAHLRPGLRLLRRWSRDEVIEHRARGELANEVRASVNRLLVAVGDPPLASTVPT
jgi:hypothetical protein